MVLRGCQTERDDGEDAMWKERKELGGNEPHLLALAISTTCTLQRVCLLHIYINNNIIHSHESSAARGQAR